MPPLVNFLEQLSGGIKRASHFHNNESNILAECVGMQHLILATHNFMATWTFAMHLGNIKGGVAGSNKNPTSEEIISFKFLIVYLYFEYLHFI